VLAASGIAQDALKIKQQPCIYILGGDGSDDVPRLEVDGKGQSQVGCSGKRSGDVLGSALAKTSWLAAIGRAVVVSRSSVGKECNARIR
jgi:hypothetical protein